MSNLIRLRRQDTGTPWGFRMSGGSESGQSIFIEKVIPRSVSYNAGMQTGDILLQIGMVPTTGMSQDQAKKEILRAGNELDFIVNRLVTPVHAPASPRPDNEPRTQVVEQSTKWRGSPQASPQLQSRSFKILQQQLGEDESDL